MPDLNTIRKKTDLLLAGTIVLDRNVTLPFPLSRSTAGPEVGSRTIILEFEDTRVKLKVAREGTDTPFRLMDRKVTTLTSPDTARPHEGSLPNSYTIMKDQEIFIAKVTPVRTPAHAPDQAFINIDATCRYRCLFCSSPDLKNYRRISNDRWISFIKKFAEKGDINSIAITSGIPESIEKNIDDFVYILNNVRDLEMTMGVEPYVTERDQLQRLYDAGARELKLNIQSWDPTIFPTICPGLDRDTILDMLGHGIEIFGRNNVCSNLIIGLGETDDSVIKGIEHLANMGVAVNLRRLHLNDQNEGRLRSSLTIEPVSPERYLRLREKQMEIFSRSNIKTDGFKTMCFPCGACDLDV